MQHWGVHSRAAFKAFSGTHSLGLVAGSVTLTLGYWDRKSKLPHDFAERPYELGFITSRILRLRSEQLHLRRLEVQDTRTSPYDHLRLRLQKSSLPYLSQLRVSLLPVFRLRPSAFLPRVFAPLCLAGVWVCSAFVVVGSACNSVARVVREVPPGRLPPSQPGLSLTWAWKFTYAAERRALFLRQLVFAKPGMLYRPNQLGNTRYNLIICVCLLEYIIITVDSVIQLIWFSVKWHTRITHN